VEAAARLGCVTAASALGAVGSQTYRADRDSLLAAVSRAYGTDAAQEIAPALSGMP
jgi:adenosine kinase